MIHVGKQIINFINVTMNLKVRCSIDESGASPVHFR